MRSVAPLAKAVTVRQHHSLVELPDSQHKPRAFDPGSGFMTGAEFIDYSARHRLTKE